VLDHFVPRPRETLCTPETILETPDKLLHKIAGHPRHVCTLQQFFLAQCLRVRAGSERQRSLTCVDRGPWVPRDLFLLLWLPDWSCPSSTILSPSQFLSLSTWAGRSLLAPVRLHPSPGTAAGWRKPSQPRVSSSFSSPWFPSSLLGYRSSPKRGQQLCRARNGKHDYQAEEQGNKKIVGCQEITPPSNRPPFHYCWVSFIDLL
jgi:hypothetical protein